MSSIRTFIGRKNFVAVPFMDGNVNISKLTLGDILRIQEMNAEAEKTQDPVANLGVMRFVVRQSVEGGAELTDEDFNTFAMGDLAKLSEDIMELSGASTKADAKN